MMNKTVLMIDGGTFFPLALRLAEMFERVMFYYPGVRPYPVLSEACIGSGFDDVEEVHELWQTVREGVDLIVFPDVGHADLQAELRGGGERVWGSGDGDYLEIYRKRLKETQKDLGMEVPKHEIILGLSSLRGYLTDHPNVYVKISKYRGDMETFHSVNIELSEPWLDMMAFKWGPLKEGIEFIVEDHLESIVEFGYDGYCIDGQFPKESLQGIECKNKAYIGTVTPWNKLPKQLAEINEAIGEELSHYSYRNFFSTEVRVTEDKTPYLTDPTCRLASPAGECLYELISNLDEIMVAGAEGELIQPKFLTKFGAQALIEHPEKPDGWRLVQVPDDTAKWFKFFSPCKVGEEMIGIPPLPWGDSTIGSVVGLGATLEDALDHLNENIESIKDQGLVIHSESIADGIKSIHDQEDAGMEFSPQEIPKPEIILKD